MKCGSSDGLALYKQEDGVVNGWCWVCETYFDEDQVEEYKEISNNNHKERKMITEEELQEVQSLKQTGWKERRISKVADERYGVYTKGGASDPIERYYPTSIDDDIIGYKIRIVEGKKFSTIGYAKSDTQMFGQRLFPAGGRFLCIAEGEESALALWQSLKKGEYETPVISPTSGTGSLCKQIKENYEYVTSFEKVIFFMDNDEPGRKATEKACKLLPPGKAFVADMKLKDCDEYTKKGRGSELRNLMFNAERFSPAGIVALSDTWDSMVNKANTVKVSLPDFAKTLEEMNRGGFALGEIVNIVAPSGVGKSSIVNRFVHHFLKNTPYKAGIVSLEADPGEYIENLMTIELGRNLSLMDDSEKVKEYSTNREYADAYKRLTRDENGAERGYIIDHQGDLVDGDLKEKIEYLVRVLDCKIILIDPLTLALSSGDNEDVDKFMSWLLRLVKRENILAINVCHVRKNSGEKKANSTGGQIHEEDVKGCVDGSTEFFTGKEWKRIDEWVPGDMVASVNSNQDLLYESPMQYLALDCNEGMYHFKNNDIDMLVSGEHKIPLIDKNGRLVTYIADQLADNVPCDLMVLSLDNKFSLNNCSVTKVNAPNNMKYCFTTSTGMFLARRNGRVFITGNSGSIFQVGMINILMMRDKEILTL